MLDTFTIFQPISLQKVHIENNIESELYDCAKGKIQSVTLSTRRQKLIQHSVCIQFFPGSIETFCQESGNKRDTVNNIGK